MTEKLEIPKNLRDDYEYAKRCGNGRLIPGHSAVRLIERIARLEQDLSAAKTTLKEDEFIAEANVYLHARLDKADATVARLTAQVDALKAPVSKIALAAAKEIDGAFDIDMPRGRNYVNGILQTMRIIIESHFTGNSREAVAARLAAAQGGKEESRD